MHATRMRACLLPTFYTRKHFHNGPRVIIAPHCAILQRYRQLVHLSSERQALECDNIIRFQLLLRCLSMLSLYSKETQRTAVANQTYRQKAFSHLQVCTGILFIVLFILIETLLYSTVSSLFYK